MLFTGCGTNGSDPTSMANRQTPLQQEEIDPKDVYNNCYSISLKNYYITTRQAIYLFSSQKKSAMEIKVI